MLGVEQRHVIFPHIDTQFSKDFSVPKFNTITIGRNKTNVEELIGQPFRFDSLSNGFTDDFIKKDFNYFDDYSNDGAWPLADFAWEGFEIYYDEYFNVIAKHRIWYYD